MPVISRKKSGFLKDQNKVRHFINDSILLFMNEDTEVELRIVKRSKGFVIHYHSPAVEAVS